MKNELFIAKNKVNKPTASLHVGDWQFAFVCVSLTRSLSTIKM